MIFAKAALAPFTPYIIGGGLLVLVGGGVGAYFWHGAKVDAAINEAVLKERASWQAARAELLELRRQRADWSAADLARKIDAIPAATTKETVRVETHWRNRPVRDCFDADLVRSLEQARAAVRQSAAASASGAAVPTGPDATATSDRQGNGKVGH
jgi:hypothetical protein